MNLISKIDAVFDRIIGALAFLAAVIIIFIMLLVSAEVVLRYFLNRPLTWDVEITEYMLLYITFLVAAWVLKKEGHVKVDILVMRLNTRVQTAFGILTSIIGIIVCGFLVWYGAQITWDSFVRHTVPARSLLAVPFAPILIIIPIGSFMLMIQFIKRTFRYIGNYKQLARKPAL